MAEITSITNSVIEQQIAELERALAEKRAALEQGAGQAPRQEGTPAAAVPHDHDKELLRGVIQERAAEMALPSQQSAVSTQPSASDNQAPYLPSPPQVEMPSYLAPELHAPVQNLVNIAFTESIDKAIQQAQASKNAALIDGFHDVLTDEVYAKLVERGKIKPVN